MVEPLHRLVDTHQLVDLFQTINNNKTYTEVSPTEARCNYCKALVARKGANTTAMAVHIQSHHPQKLCAAATLDNVFMPLLKQDSQEAKALRTSIIKFVCEELRPISIVESPHLRAALEAVRPGAASLLPSRKVTKRLLAEAAADVKKEISEEFGGGIPGVATPTIAKACVLAFDGWTTSSMTAFLAVFVYYVSSAWQLQVRLLAVREVASHTAQAISDAIQSIRAEYPLLCPWASIADTTNANPCACSIAGLAYYKCLAHVLQLAAQTIYKQESQILGRVNDVITFFRRSSTATAQLKEEIGSMVEANLLPQDVGNKRKLIANNETRWTSTFASVTRLLELAPAVRQVLLAREKFDIILTDAEIHKLQNIVKLLEFPKALVLFFERQEALFCESLPRVFAMVEVIRSQQFQDLSAAQLAATFCDELQRRLVEDAGFLDHLAITMFDPQFRSLSYLPQHLRQFAAPAKSRFTQIYESCLQTEIKSHQELVAPQPPAATRPTQAATTAADLIEQHLRHKSTTATTTTAPAARRQSEVGEYFSLPVPSQHGALAWWRENERLFPNLAVLAKRFLAIPASTSEVERLFSAGELITENRRNLTSASLAEQMLLIRFNSMH